MAPVQEKQLTEKRTHIETESCIVKAGSPGTDAEKNRTPETEADHAQDIERSAADRTRDIERSIIKRFRKEIWRPFVKALNEYQMIQEGDRIAVCISGGKDSMLLAKCMQEILRHGKMQFGLEFLVMDPGYRPENRSLIEENAGILGIPVHIFQSDIFQVVSDVEDSPCYLCARMRRGESVCQRQRTGLQ